MPQCTLTVANRCRASGGGAGDDVAGFNADPASHPPFRLDQQEAAQVGPVPLRVHMVQVLGIAQGPTPADLDPPVIPVHSEVGSVGTILELRLALYPEGLRQGGPQCRLVLLDGQHIASLLRPNVPGKVLLAAEGIEGDGGDGQVQQGQHLGEGRELIRLRCHGRLRQYQPALIGVGADRVQGRPAPVAVVRAPGGLAVQGHHSTGQQAVQGLHSPGQPHLQLLRVEEGEDPPKSVVGGDALRQAQLLLKSDTMVPTELLHFHPGGGGADDGSQGQSGPGTEWT